MTMNAYSTPGASDSSDVQQASTTTDRTVQGDLRVSAVFSDHMVLQQRKPIAVFGSAPTGRGVTARILSDDEVISEAASSAGDDGRWMISMPKLPAGGPYTLTVDDGRHTVLYTDVMVGEVWLAGGQSNMELALRDSRDGRSVAAAAHDTHIRFYNSPQTGVIDDKAEAESAWRPADGAHSGDMSAVAFYFARKLRKEMPNDLTIGIVDCYHGGTSISCWTDQETLERTDQGRRYLDRFHQAIAGRTQQQLDERTALWEAASDAWNADVATARRNDPQITWRDLHARYGECPWPPPANTTSHFRPTGLFNAMLARLAPYSIAGFLWYQGEEDESYCNDYEVMLRQLIGLWRRVWCDDTLPFLIVQLPQWISQEDRDNADTLRWPVIRQAQWTVAESTPNTYIIITMDCGEFDNIHPVDKQTPGERLADVALSKIYSIDESDVSSPSLVTAHRAPGNKAVLMFRHACGLHFSDAICAPKADEGEQEPAFIRLPDSSGFELAGSDGHYHPAQAAISSDCTTQEESVEGGDGMVTLFSPHVTNPTHVRYAWRSWGPAPMFNEQDLPAAPFATALK
jgi:sialate O-acetylesterase